jgi:hypothetical protein
MWFFFVRGAIALWFVMGTAIALKSIAGGAISSCNPHQMNVPDYQWGWPTGQTSLSTFTVEGELAQAVCNW